jgi:hypothetical protein
MLKKLIGVVAVIIMALIVSTSAAGAQGPPPGLPPGPPAYPPPRNIIIAPGNPDLVFPPGGPATFQAECFLPGSTVTFALDGVSLGTAVADENGVATINTTIPADTPLGPATVTATGTGCDGEVLSLVLGITVARAQPAAPLPRTGSSNTLPMAQIAVATIVAGGFLLIMANRRRAAVVPVTTQRSPEV